MVDGSPSPQRFAAFCTDPTLGPLDQEYSKSNSPANLDASYLFDRFDAALREAGYVAMGGQIVDASLIAAPKQRNTEDEKKAI